MVKEIKRKCIKFETIYIVSLSFHPIKMTNTRKEMRIINIDERKICKNEPILKVLLSMVSP